jgi:hypothetical protein
MPMSSGGSITARRNPGVTRLESNLRSGDLEELKGNLHLFPLTLISTF